MLGTLQLVPEFDPEVTSYTAETTDATNKVTATASDPEAVILIEVNGAAHENDTSATWLVGTNTVTVHVACGEVEATYTVIVTKAGTLGSLTVASVAGTEVGDTAITVTEPLTEGCTYKYQTGADLVVPELDDDLSEWDAWDGESDIAATTGEDIIIAEVALGGLAKAAGKTTVAAKAEG